MIREQQITENVGAKVVVQAVPATRVSLDRILMATDLRVFPDTLGMCHATSIWK